MTNRATLIPDDSPVFLAKPARDMSAFIEFRIHRNWVIAILLSLLLHAVLLLSNFPKLFPMGEMPAQASSTITVNLAPFAENKVAIKDEAPIINEQPEKSQEQKKISPKKTLPLNKPKPAQIPVFTQPLPATSSAPPPVASSPSPPNLTLPPPKPSTPTDTAPITDMMSYVNAAKARRRAAGDAGLENEAAAERERAPTANEIRSAIIARNLKPEGQNGLFRILSKDGQYARFSYRGWTNDPNNARQEIIDVDAGSGGDVEHAIIKRMIQIIRQHYKEDFNWHSQRLDRVIVLSARVEDTAGLEDFLKRELFGSQGALPVQY